jgi:predicted DNA-binding protein
MPKRRSSRRRRAQEAPQQPRDRLAEIRAEIRDIQQQIEAKRRDTRAIRTPEDLKARECSIAALTNKLAALLLAEAMQASIEDPENRSEARSLTQGAGHTIKDQGRRDVTLRTTCGQVEIRVTYFSRNCDRDKAGKGMYPMLVLWGVHDRCTAGIVSEVSKLVAMLGSLEEVEQVLSDRGQSLDIKTIRALAYRFATRARAAQSVGSLNWGETVAGRRVVLSTDGGRIRIRTTKRGPKTAKGRNRYRTDWREPKLLIIYVVDEKGHMDRKFLAVIDGTLGGPDAIFKLMEFYLRELKITTADKILFVADGARWIWNRVGALLRRLGIEPEQVNELVDFYHAVEHLGKIAALQHCWTVAERQTWIGRQRRCLLKGRVEGVQAAIKALCGPRSSKALKRERDYFNRNAGKGRMDYARVAALKLPIGSGAIESAIRRVINLRLKGPSIYWHKDSAEAVLLLRSYYKAGRWNHLEKQALTTTTGIAA